MKPAIAQGIFIFLNFAAICAVFYVGYDLHSLHQQIDNGQKRIMFDTGTSYLLIMSVFWGMSFIQLKGRDRSHFAYRYAGALLIGWFILTLLGANLVNIYTSNRLDQHGYAQTVDPAEISRLARGRSYIYIKQ